jgi:hypothetical protein
MNNVPFYDKGGVRITKGLFEVPSGRQFSIKNIDSVEMVTNKPNRKNPIICIVIGVLSIAFYGLGIILIIAGILWWRFQKNIYSIFVTTAGTKGEAYHDYDINIIQEIRSALNAAIEAS